MRPWTPGTVSTLRSRHCLCTSTGTVAILFTQDGEGDDSLVSPGLRRNTLLKAGKTVVLASNQLYFVKDADLVVYTSEGRVAEAGPYPKLMAAGGQFATMMKEVQVDEEEEEGQQAQAVVLADGSATAPAAAMLESNKARMGHAVCTSQATHSSGLSSLKSCPYPPAHLPATKHANLLRLQQMIASPFPLFLVNVPSDHPASYRHPPLNPDLPPPPHPQAALGARLTSEETSATGSISAAVLFSFVLAMGGPLWFLWLALGYVLTEALRVATTVWLSIWTGRTDSSDADGGDEGRTAMFYLVCDSCSHVHLSIMPEDSSSPAWGPPRLQHSR